MLAKTTRAYDEILKFGGLVLKGRTLVIDPSIGSSSSMPGWCALDQGEEVGSGIIEIVVSRDIPDRLQQLHAGMRQLISTWKPDILVYEDIPAQRHGGGNAVAHASLLKALGAILAVPGPVGFIGLHPLTWKRLVRDSYVKSDEGDAREMAFIVVELARWIHEEAEKKAQKEESRRKQSTNKSGRSGVLLDSEETNTGRGHGTVGGRR